MEILEIDGKFHRIFDCQICGSVFTVIYDSKKSALNSRRRYCDDCREEKRHEHAVDSEIKRRRKLAKKNAGKLMDYGSAKKIDKACTKALKRRGDPVDFGSFSLTAGREDIEDTIKAVAYGTDAAARYLKSLRSAAENISKR